MQFRRFLCVYANRPFIAWSRSPDADEKKLYLLSREGGGAIGKEQDLQEWGGDNETRVILSMWNDLIFLIRK